MAVARRKYDNEIKSERMELRLRPSAKQVIQRAMAISGLSASDLAYQAARQVIAEHEHILLAGADRDSFLELLANPPPANDRLKRAFKRHRQATS